MAARNPYSLLGPQNASTLENIGAMLLSTGQVTPDQALAALEPQNKKRKRNPVFDTYPALEPETLDVAMSASDGRAAMAQKKLEAAAAAFGDGTVNIPSPGEPAVFQKVPAPMAPVARGSGLSLSMGAQDSQEEGNKAGSKTTMQQMLTMDPEQFQGLYDVAAATPAFREQTEGVRTLQDILALQAKGPVDYLTGPLAALLQSETGRDTSGLMRSRTAPTPQEQNQLLISGLTKLQDDKRDISKSIIDAIGKQKAGTLQEMVYQDLLSKSVQKATTESKAQDPNRAMGQGAAMTDLRVKEKDVRDKLDKSMDPLAAGYQQLSNAKEAIETGHWGEVAGILSIMVKNVGADAGALSEGDIARQLPRTFAGDLTKVAAYINSNPSEQLDPQLTKGLKNLIQIAAKNIQKRYSDAIKRQTAQFKGSASFRNVNVDSIVAPAMQQLKDLEKGTLAPGRRKDASGYDGSGPLPANATREQKLLRQDYLHEKGGGH